MTSETAYRLELLKGLLDAADAKVTALAKLEPTISHAMAEISIDMTQARVLIAEWQTEK